MILLTKQEYAAIAASLELPANFIANDTVYGLTASLFTANNRRAIRGARAIRAGTVTVNCFGEGDITTPFGGYKQSGFGGRDNYLHAHDQCTQLKTIWLDLGDAGIDDVDS
ncbi:MAG: gamma-glutamyl-gamma-aminobutyraldehyde dehydrogenase [Parasphingorhabdus sp.]|jgi:gamma-glutamyl-gamma-aminobutyraldehyde dehydrogenase